MKKGLIFLVLAVGAGLFLRHQYRSSRASLTLDTRAFVNGIPTIRPDMKLVVASLELTQSLSAESPKVAWGVDWGTTKAVVSAPARVHYAIDLSGVRPVEFRLDSRDRLITAVFPDPEVQAVEVFFESKQAVVEAGWGRFKAFSGRSLVDDLDRRLYAGARAEAAAEPALRQVRDQARPGLEKLVSAYLLGSGERNLRVAAHFRSELPGPAQFPFQTASRN